MTTWNKCPRCTATISSDAVFCPDCGEPWTVKCPRCGTSWRFWKRYRFCICCGAPMEDMTNIVRAINIYCDTPVEDMSNIAQTIRT